MKASLPDPRAYRRLRRRGHATGKYQNASIRAGILKIATASQIRAMEVSRADLAKNCAFRDKSMKLGTWFLDILRSILRNGATSDLTFGDL